LNVDRIGLGGAPATSLDLSAKSDAVRLPTGTSAERPGTPANGDTRYNSTLNAVESYVNGSWQTVSTGDGTVTSVGANAPLSSSGGTTPTISVSRANASTDGYLASGDWATFNSKVDSALPAGQILVGDGSNAVAGVALSGDATISSAGAVTLTSTGTAGTYTKVTTDAKGRVTVGDTLSAGDIPNLDAAKITSGVLDAARIPAGTDSGKLPLAGGTMSGSIDMGGNNVTNAGSVAASTVTVGGNNVISTNAPLTSGSVLFANGAASAGQDNSNFFWDNANKRLGIGTGSPGVKLNVYSSETVGSNLLLAIINSVGSDNRGSSIFRVSRNGNYLDIEQNAGNGGFRYGTFADTNFINSLNSLVGPWGNLNFLTGGAGGTGIAMVIAGGTRQGNVGIGTTSPTSVLHLKAGTATANTAPLKFTAGTSLTTPEVGALEFDGTNLYFSTNTTNRQTFAFQGSAGTLSGLTSGSVLFANGAASAGQDNGNFFWDNTNKRLGIGTVNPGAKLDIYDVSSAFPASSGASQSAGQRLRLGRTDGAVLDIGSAGGSGLWLQTGNGLNLATTYPMLINPNGGNVGIGTTSPETTLHVSGRSQFIDTSGYNNRAIIIGRTTTDAAVKSSALTSRHWLNSEEPVTLIGAAIDDSAVSAVAIGGGYTNNNAATELRFYTAPDNTTLTGTRKMTLVSSGNVGIGTTNPNGKLDVNQTTAGSVAVQGQNAGTVYWKVVSPAGGITGGYNAADAVEYVAKDSVTGRSINAAGTINASGADFAEWVDWEGPIPAMGSIVMYRGVYVVVSSTQTAAFVGNDIKEPGHGMLVAFAGQLPVLVRGKVHEGDLIVANGDGTGRGVPRSSATMAEIQNAVGTSWASSSDLGLKRVNVAVGIGLAGGSLVDKKILRLETENVEMKVENKRLTTENEQIKNRLGQIEKRLSGMKN
jgi:hypothetical protein